MARGKTKKVTEIVQVLRKKIQLAFRELLIEHWGIEPEGKLQQFYAKTALS